MSNKIIFSIALFSASVLLSPIATAQPVSEYESAQSLLAAGQAEQADAAFSQVLLTAPNDPKALLGRATARSWSGRFDAAIADYKSLLSVDPDNLEALTGLAYAQAWRGDFETALVTFEAAEALAPDNLGVQKGIASTRLWMGDASKAAEAFEAITHSNPNDAEAFEGAGQAHLALGHARRAESAFNEAIRLEPGRASAERGLHASYTAPPALEATVWAGNSAEGGDVGIRSAELAGWLSHRTRLGVRYDNSLSLDNPALARSSVDAEAWFVGAQHQFNEALTAVVEVGQRSLPQGADQQIYKAEGILNADGKYFKLGGQFSPHSAGYDDKLVYAGINVSVVEHVRLDATLFASESGALGDNEIRGALYTEYTSPRRWTMGAGVSLGDVSSDLPGANGTVTTAHVLASTPFAKRHTAYIQARWEDAPLNEYSAIMVGVTLRLPRS